MQNRPLIKDLFFSKSTNRQRRNASLLIGAYLRSKDGQYIWQLSQDNLINDDSNPKAPKAKLLPEPADFECILNLNY